MEKEAKDVSESSDWVQLNIKQALSVSLVCISEKITYKVIEEVSKLKEVV